MKTAVLQDQMMLAIKQKDKAAVCQLIVEQGLELNPLSAEGTYLSWAWGRFGGYDFELIQLLIEHGAELNDPSFPAIVCAAGRGKLEELKYVLDRGADVNAANPLGHSAMWHAVYGEFVEEAELLLEAGLRLDVHGEKSLVLAASIGSLPFVKLLVERGVPVDGLGDKDGDGGAPLHQAAMYGHLEVVQYLLHQGADVTVRNNYGQTARDVAELNEQADIAALLKSMTDGFVE
ncbi:Ankyrin [Paenibacillus curdlanolyticus YK9]|uniref:Ankyrin n=1 Tax=Paenibacillus curdlanolyticus YK9 TaxID=717606 RepID=E0I884_9BACL|nr:ankyrin repeat domain-containing protein [Paenibacillus curdlanolyticus]EFM11389.1 Ankyrin [Paenibacillus curdlanolyticus YK9]